MKAGDKRGRFQQSLRGKPILHVVSNFGEREDIEDNACARTKLGRYAILRRSSLVACPPSFAHAGLYHARCFLSSKLDCP